MTRLVLSVDAIAPAPVVGVYEAEQPYGQSGRPGGGCASLARQWHR